MIRPGESDLLTWKLVGTKISVGEYHKEKDTQRNGGANSYEQNKINPFICICLGNDFLTFQRLICYHFVLYFFPEDVSKTLNVLRI